MKEATGELNGTLMVVIAIAADEIHCPYRG